MGGQVLTRLSLAAVILCFGGAATAGDVDMQWLEARVAAGDVPATTELATRLELGVGVEADPRRAMGLFCRAARVGSRIATLHIAAWLLTDDSPDYNPEQAAAWLRQLQTAERGIRYRPAGSSFPRCPTDDGKDAVAPPAALLRIIDRMALEQGVDAGLVKAVIATESDYRADVVSSAGAAGLMQLMPATARQYGVGNRFDVGENLRAGIAHLAYLLRRYDGDSDRALAAYNAGEAAVDRCRCIPDIPETVAYVGHVRALLAASRTTPSRADMASQPSHRRPGP